LRWHLILCRIAWNLNPPDPRFPNFEFRGMSHWHMACFWNFKILGAGVAVLWWSICLTFVRLWVLIITKFSNSLMDVNSHTLLFHDFFYYKSNLFLTKGRNGSDEGKY
jgi:hypothetical protein